MDRCVLDTSVIVKSLFKPSKSLSEEVYKREMETHKKCIFIVKKIEEDDVEIYIPKVCVVETAAVIRRLANKTLSVKISKGILDSYEVIDEMLIFDSAWEIAVKTGCSGFDSYFIALAKIKKAALFTDDGGSHHHAKEIGVDSILIRNTELVDIEKFILE
jgi:predicted nucleic acid-binding protein